MNGGSKGMRLRVAVVTETFPPEINGVANTMRHLVEGLEGHGHQVHLIRPRQRGERTAANTGERRQSLVPGLPIPGYRGLRFGLPVYWRLRRAWRTYRPDVVYIATQGPLGHAALTAARSAGVPAVTGFHTQFHQYSKHYGFGLLTDSIIRTLRRFHNRSDATLVPTAKLRDELIELGFQQVHIFSRGVDTELFAPSRRNRDLRRSWNAQEGSPVLLYVGRLAAEKNLDLALEAFRAVQQRRPDARFVVVGDGPELERLRGLHGDCIFTGAKVGVELAEHYSSGDLFLFPSLTETFGNVVPEAMASGLAVIAFDYAAAGFHIRSRENGITVTLGDAAAFVRATVETVEDDAHLRALGEQARATAEDIGWPRVILSVEERLFDVIRRRRGPEGRHEAMATTPE